MDCARVVNAVALAAAMLVPATAASAEPFTLTSTAFADGGVMAKKYAGFHPDRQPPCGGENVSPPLAWTMRRPAPRASRS